MAEQEGGGGAEGGGAPAADAGESADTGFYNRRLHNYPLIKVHFFANDFTTTRCLTDGHLS